MSSVVREWTQRLSYERTTQGRPWSCHSREQWYNGAYPWGAISHSWDPSAASLHTRAGGLDPANDQVDTRGGDELPASNEDGDPNPTNSDPTGPTNTAVGSGKHQGGYYCKGGQGV